MKKLIYVLIFAALCAPAFAKEKSIAELNPEFEERVIQALKPKNTVPWEYKNTTQPLCLFFFSDVHGDARALDRCMRFYDRYEKYFDDAVCAGDVVEASVLMDFSYWGKTKGAEKVLIALGNHESQKSHLPDGEKGYVLHGVSYERYFAPFIKNWNVVNNPDDTWYYKDYTEKKIRLVVIDCMMRKGIDDEGAEAQFAWFRKVLTDARVKGLHVLMVNHIPLYNMAPIECNFTNLDLFQGDASETVRYQEEIEKFKEKGGEFICWLGGHNHWDQMGYNKDFPTQLSFCTAAACDYQCEVYSDMMRVKGTRCNDCVNAVIIDTTCDTLKVIRAGANIDSYLRPHNTIAINYKTLEVISQN
ncbi:MAG: metallophosphoesterase [Abditibacteriota bacterium]|nr:metallophosphoesterase [Abditibacteriota bacterium]